MSVIGLFGLSGVGKSHFSSIIKDFLPSLICIKASDLLRNANAEVVFNNLSNSNVKHNQDTLCNEFLKFRTVHQEQNILIELHNTIEMPDGFEFINDDLFVKMNLTKAIFLQLSPDKLHSQRLNDKSRTRKNLSLPELTRLQNTSKQLFNHTFSIINVPVTTLDSDDVEIMNKFRSFTKL